ncbi:MAG TPA: hypothetical protein VHY79_11530 [Rhizomicrobium sp.]|nr:hypothetical protein [Rhizomicrobium sp.]
MRHQFCDGIDAAVKAEPDAFANTRPRTMLGLIVHSLVRGAATGRCDQIKLVVFFLDEAERRRGVVEHIVAPDADSQGNSEPKPAPPPQWDWSEDGAWDSTMRADDEKAAEEKEQSETRAEALREEIGDRFRRALEAERINTERRVRMELEREGRNAVPETVAAPFSGNISPARDPHAGTVRIGGRIVDV